MSDRPCTCHPDDNPPVPCPQKFALQECRDGTFGTWIASYRAVNGLLRQRAERAERERDEARALLRALTAGRFDADAELLARIDAFLKEEK